MKGDRSTSRVKRSQCDTALNSKSKSMHLARRMPQEFEIDPLQALQDYKRLCVELRRKNQTLKNQLIISKSQNHKQLQSLKKQIYEIATKKHNKKQEKVQKKTITSSHGNRSNKSNRSNREWCGTFVESLTLIDPKLAYRFREAKSINAKMMLTRCAMSEIVQFLIRNKFKFQHSLL